MPELFVGGRRGTAVESGAQEIRCPADSGPVTVVGEAGSLGPGAAVVPARETSGRGP